METTSSGLSLKSYNSSESLRSSHQGTQRRRKLRIDPPSAWTGQAGGSRIQGKQTSQERTQPPDADRTVTTRNRSSSLGTAAADTSASSVTDSIPAFDFSVSRSGKVLTGTRVNERGERERLKSATWKGSSPVVEDTPGSPSLSSSNRPQLSGIFGQRAGDGAGRSNIDGSAVLLRQTSEPPERPSPERVPSDPAAGAKQGIRRRLFSKVSANAAREAASGGGGSARKPGPGFVRRVSSRSFFRRQQDAASGASGERIQTHMEAGQSTETLGSLTAEGAEPRASKDSARSNQNPISAWAAARRRTKSSSPALSLDANGEELPVTPEATSPANALAELPRSSVESHASSRASILPFGRKRGQSFVSVASSTAVEGTARNGEGFPKRLSGWIMNVVGGDEQTNRDRSESASPTNEASEGGGGRLQGINAALNSSSPTSAHKASSSSPHSTPEPNRSSPAGFLSSLGNPSARPFRFFMESTGDLLGRSDNTDGSWLLGVWHGKDSPDSQESSSPVEAVTPSIMLSAATPQGNKVSRLHNGNASSSASASRSSIDIPESPYTARSTGGHASSPSSVPSLASSSRTAEIPRWQQEFLLDYHSRIWLTYRSQFAAIARDGAITREAAMTAEQTSLTGFVPSSPTSAAQNTPHANNPFNFKRLAASGPSSAIGSALANASHAASTSPVMTAAGGLGERMGIPGLWQRATAVAQAAGLAGKAGLTTDAGWGCMLRTGQSLLANALMHKTFGRNWRRPTGVDLDDGEGRAAYARYVEILTWFMDDPSPACPFSVHRMAREGKRLGKEVGEWFGPSTAAGAIQQLVDDTPQAGLGVVVATDGEIYLSQIRAASRGLETKAVWEKPVLLLIGIRLGLSGVHPSYYESIKVRMPLLLCMRDMF